VQIYSGNMPLATYQEAPAERKPMPTMQLTGHQSEIYTLKFSPDGDYLASAGNDRQIFFWDVSSTENPPTNVGVLKGHKNAILELAWSP